MKLTKKQAKLILVFIWLCTYSVQASTPGQKVGKAGVVMAGCAAAAVLLQKNKLATGLACSSLGSFILAPVVEEYWHKVPYYTKEQYKKLPYILTAAVTGFSLVTLGAHLTLESLYYSTR